MLTDDPHHSRRWTILAILAIAQLMVVLDTTIVNIALPTAQRALHFGNSERQWVVTAYALAFGSLLLLGGRISDLLGRKWTFIAGLAGFATASAVGGAAQSFGMLAVARAFQGAFGALLAPAALSLMTTTFIDPRERNKAFGIWGAIAGSGGAIGLLLGGVLTQGYATGILPALIMLGIGLGLVFSTSINSATLGVEAAHAGVASATVSASQQIGGSLGTALLSTIAATAITSFITSAHAHPTKLLLAHAAVHSDTTAFAWAAAIFAAGAVIAAALFEHGTKALRIAATASPATTH